ncbi:MAG TPA: hypothetical protein VHO69_05055, partial [Phototrophicaceae bacterium]|nr:hypothetical protein [Phototrophicaceae bacterium]
LDHPFFQAYPRLNPFDHERRGGFRFVVHSIPLDLFMYIGTMVTRLKQKFKVINPLDGSHRHHF